VLRQILPVMATGTAAGLALALAFARVISIPIFGVSVYDPRLMAASILVSIATALGAARVPSRKAASIDPLAALRHGE
jgi:ABC-type antimicrobial peptide transport system permease subunit